MSLIKEGFILKQGEKFSGWKKRYLRLYEDRNQLRFDYFKSPTSDLQGTFGLSGDSQFRVLSPPASPLPVSAMEITTPFRVYLISAESEAELQEWVWIVQKLQAHLAQAVEGAARPRLGSESGGFRAGYLYKKGAKRRNWKRRWFVLSGKTLRYFPSSDKMKEPLGEIDLGKAVEVHKEFVAEGPVDQRYMFSIATPGRTYFMAAHSEAELEGWLRTLVRHGLHVQNSPSGQYSRFYLQQNESPSDDEDDHLDFQPGAAVASSGAAAAVPKESWPFLAPAGLSLPFEEIHRIFRPAALSK